MAGTARAIFLATLLMAGAATAHHVPKVRTYILDGYSFSGIHGVNAAELEAKLKQHAGARISRADVDADTAIVAKELKARHMEGHLFTTTAEHQGRVWIIFDLLNPESSPEFGHLEALNFQGASHVSAGALATATGLKKGDELSRENMLAARRAIVLAYRKSMPGKTISVKARLQRHGGKTNLTWVIDESPPVAGGGNGPAKPASPPPHK